MPYTLRGVTGSTLQTVGQVQVNVRLGGYFNFEITAVVVEKPIFPGDLLIGFSTMREQDITVSPARGGAKCSYKFIPFIRPQVQVGPIVPITQRTDRYRGTYDENKCLNNVAERSNEVNMSWRLQTGSEEKTNAGTPSTSDNVKVTKQHRKVNPPKQDCNVKPNKGNLDIPEVALKIVPGYVADCTLLQSMSINKVTLELKGVRKNTEVIALPETMRMKGVYLDSAVYNTELGKVDILLLSLLNKDITLKAGTQIGSFQVCTNPIKIVNENQKENDENAQYKHICSVQEDLDLRRNMHNHLKPTSRPDLEQSLINLLLTHSEAVALPGDALGKTSVLKHHIKLRPGTQPIYIPAYRLPHSKLATVDKLINEMLEQDVIEPSNSEWNFPLILVPKSDGTMRPVIDYRELNKHTIPDRLPLPVISDILRSLGTENTLFTTIDIKAAFWQIELHEDSKDLTAFSTPTGHYRFKRMPFGLSNSPLTYMRLMNTILHGLIGNTANVFLDDILIASKTEEEHFKKLNLVFSKLVSAGLKVKLEKCSFLQDKVIYLGHQIDRHGLRTVQSKVDAVRNFPEPNSVDKVRSFLGLTGYYRQFIKGYANIAQPLSSLLKKNVTFTWETTQKEAFETLKEKLTSSPVLIFPDYTKDFILCTDASDIGLGGILMQERNGTPQPIAYASRLCTAAEKNYSITERETLAVIYCLEKFRDMLLGYKIRVWTDHTAIQNLFKHKNLRGRLARWFTTLQNYDVSFEYIPGRKNVAADALSRNINSESDTKSLVCGIQELITINDDLVKTELGKDNTWKDVVQHLLNPTTYQPPKLPAKYKIDDFQIHNGMLYRNNELKGKGISRGLVKQLVIPHTLVPDVLNLLHDSVHSSHPGREKTYQQAQLKYFWPSMRKDIYSHIDNCMTCAKVKGYTHLPAPMLTYPVPQKPWERVHIDTLELPMSENGYKYLLVAIDYLSRFCILQPMPDKKAKTIASVITDQIICNFTTPKMIVSDNGPEFNNQILEELCKLFNIKKINVLAYHPQSNGVVERLNRKIITCLRSLINPHSITWDTWIPHVKCALNSQINSPTGETPHYIIYGEEKVLPYEVLDAKLKPLYNEDDYIASRIHQFQLIHQRVRNHMKEYSLELQKQQHKIAHKVRFQSGDLVMAKLHVPVANSNKLSPRFTGPYKIIANTTGNKFKIQHIETGEVTIRHADDLKITRMLKETHEPELYPENNTANDPNEDIQSTNTDMLDDTNETHEYRKKLRSHYKELAPDQRSDKSERVMLVCNITELLLRDEFDDYVKEILEELSVDINSFYR